MVFKVVDNLFKEHSQKIKIFLSVETITDPYEKTVSNSVLNSLPIKAIVTDLTPTQMKWKSNGIIEDDGKEIIIEKKHRSLIEKSYKIRIGDNNYLGWKQNGKMVIREEDNYLRIYLYRKHD